MKEQNLKIYWCYDCHKKWLPLERPLLKSSVDVSDFLEAQDYFLEPDFVVGDEFNFIALFEHPFKEEYLFHLVVDDFSKVFFANSAPAMLHVMAELNELLNSYFKTNLILLRMDDDE